jgi:hypothetical protein
VSWRQDLWGDRTYADTWLMRRQDLRGALTYDSCMSQSLHWFVHPSLSYVWVCTLTIDTLKQKSTHIWAYAQTHAHMHTNTHSAQRSSSINSFTLTNNALNKSMCRVCIRVCRVCRGLTTTLCERKLRLCLIRQPLEVRILRSS